MTADFMGPVYCVCVTQHELGDALFVQVGAVLQAHDPPGQIDQRLMTKLISTSCVGTARPGVTSTVLATFGIPAP